MQFTRETHTIDATDKAPGRLASEIATILIGKHKPQFTPNMDIGDFVKVENASKMKMTAKKAEQKAYYRHSGYPGGLKTTLLKAIWAKNPGEVLRRSVSRMLPKNTHRSTRLKRLHISN